MVIEVVAYNPEWKEWFKHIRNEVWAQVGDLVLDVVHVGSTSVEGLAAKPIIDMDIVVQNMDDFEEIKTRLARLGYEHQGDLGIKGREAFKLDHEHKYKHHLYLCLVDSIAYRNHLALKKHLTENQDARKRYGDLKLGLGETSENIENYWKAKTEMILEFLEAEGIEKEVLDSIREDNL